MLSHGFKWSDYESCVYLKIVNGSAIYLLLYIDDMLIAVKDKLEIAKLKVQLSKEFEMKDLDAAKKILGMEMLEIENLVNYTSVSEVILKRFFVVSICIMQNQ
jgi:hypothetical protein